MVVASGRADIPVTLGLRTVPLAFLLAIWQLHDFILLAVIVFLLSRPGGRWTNVQAKLALLSGNRRILKGCGVSRLDQSALLSQAAELHLRLYQGFGQVRCDSPAHPARLSLARRLLNRHRRLRT